MAWSWLSTAARRQSDYAPRLSGGMDRSAEVVSVQRDLLLRPGARQVLRGGLGVGAAVPDPFAVGNLSGPLTVGHFFDTIGRRKMITGTYLLSGLLPAVSAVLFNAGVLNAITQTVAWCVIFYFASAGASAAYLTVSEIFPLEVRAKAIAVFFAIAQCFGALGPVIYGALIGDGSQPVLLFPGHLFGAAVDGRGTRRLIPRGRCRRQVAEGATRPDRP